MPRMHWYSWCREHGAKNPRRQHRRAGCSDSSHNPLRDDFSRSRREGLPRDNEQLIARPPVLSTRSKVLEGPDWAPDLIFGHRLVSRERLDKNLDRLRRSSLIFSHILKRGSVSNAPHHVPTECDRGPRIVHEAHYGVGPTRLSSRIPSWSSHL